MTLASSGSLSEEDIVWKLQQQTRRSDPLEQPNFPEHEPARPAAVLVPFIKISTGMNDPGWHILYTRRTDLVHDHKGQVSFPGGRADPEDPSLIDTALRESYEEIGLHPSSVKILGQMQPLKTITNYLVTPVIGLIPWPYPFKLQPQEVCRVFTIPVDWMVDPDHYEIRQRVIPPDFQLAQLPRNLQVIYFSPFDGETLWGATAEITIRLLKLLGLIVQ